MQMFRIVATVAIPFLLVSAGFSGVLRASDEAAHILLFGGEDNDVYLGCFSCNALDVESVFNAIGPYGSAVSPTSIANRLSQYGSKISPHSVCNEVALSPPVLVDEKGTFYGELTVNPIRPRRVTASRVVEWLAAFCASE